MLPELTAVEARIIGCLMEKSVITPDQYPLTLNALTNACNQKSARDPVMALGQGIVQRTVRDLAGKHLLRIEENFRRGTEKYSQRFCNSRYSSLQLDPAEFAVICLLLLRGAQTPGELRARSGRLHTFADNEVVVETLAGLMQREGGPLVEQLPRTPGRRDSEYMHLFSGPASPGPSQPQPEPAAKAGAEVGVRSIAERLAALEAEVAELRSQIEALGRARSDEAS